MTCRYPQFGGEAVGAIWLSHCTGCLYSISTREHQAREDLAALRVTRMATNLHSGFICPLPESRAIGLSVRR